MRRGVALLVVLLLGGALAAACRPEGTIGSSGGDPPSSLDSGPGVTEAAAGGGTLRWAIEEPQAIVPPEAVDPGGLTVVDALFDSLTRWDEGLEPAAAAARSWEVDEDQRTWTFRLRADGTFNDDDGTPVHAGDFAYAWSLAVADDEAGHHLRNVVGYEELRRGDAVGLRGVRALDDHTLQVTLTEPDAAFASVVAHPALGPVARARWEADPRAYRAQPIGNGPFRVAEPWVPGQFIRLNRAPGWQPPDGVAPVTLDEIVFQLMDRDTAYLAFQQGRIDVAELPGGALQDATERFGRSADGYTGPGLLTGETAAVYYLGFDLAVEPFDDPEVRRAISLAIDRRALVRVASEGATSVARALTPPALMGRRTTCPACRHDTAAAAAVFAERGISELRLSYNRGGGHEQVAQRLRADLGRAGVRLAYEPLDLPEYLAALRQGGTGMFRFGWSADYPVGDEVLRSVLHGRSIPSGPGDEDRFNFGRYADEDVDRLLDEARAAPHPGERLQRLLEAEGIAIGRDQAVVPLFVYRHRTVVGERVSGFRLDPMGRVDLSDVGLGRAPGG